MTAQAARLIAALALLAATAGGPAQTDGAGPPRGKGMGLNPEMKAD